MSDPASEQAFVAHRHKWWMAVRLFLCLGMATVGLWLAGLFGLPPGEPIVFYYLRPGPYVGLACTILFGYGGRLYLLRMLDKRPAVKIDRQGVMFRSPYLSTLALSDRSISWAQIRDIGIVTLSGQYMVGLNVVDPNKFVRGKGLHRVLNSFVKQTGYDSAISVDGTDRSFDELISAIERFAPSDLHLTGANA